MDVISVLPPLAAAADELEQQMRGDQPKRQIAEFVNDQQLRFGQLSQPLLEFSLRMPPMIRLVNNGVAEVNSTE